MSSQAQNGPRWRNSPFGGRDADTPSPGPPPGHARSKSSIMQSPSSPNMPLGHVRNQSASDLRPSGLARSDSRRLGSARGGVGAGTFAPQFIKQENLDGAADRVRGIEGENDFSGKRYVWLRDDVNAFVKGWVMDELPESMLRIQCDDGSVCIRVESLELTNTDRVCSNDKFRPTASTKLIQRSSTRPTIWRS